MSVQCSCVHSSACSGGCFRIIYPVAPIRQCPHVQYIPRCFSYSLGISNCVRYGRSKLCLHRLHSKCHCHQTMRNLINNLDKSVGSIMKSHNRLTKCGKQFNFYYTVYIIQIVLAMKGTLFVPRQVLTPAGGFGFLTKNRFSRLPNKTVIIIFYCFLNQEISSD